MFKTPVRKVVKKGKGSRRGCMPMSLKIKRGLEVESMNEFDLSMILEVDPNVEFYCEQPHTFTYKRDGKDHTYTPDFWVRLKNSATELMIEVKPWEKANSEKWQDFFSYVRPVIEGDGYKYVILTDRDIRRMPRLQNVRDIFYGSQVLANDGHLIRLMEITNGKQQMTFSELSKITAANDNLPNAYSFIRSGLARIDMSKPLNDNAVLSFQEP